MSIKQAKTWIEYAKKRLETMAIDDIKTAQWQLDKALEELNKEEQDTNSSAYQTCDEALRHG